MGLGLRLFIVKDDDTFTRFPVARLERMVLERSGERYPEFAGQRVRYALLAVELEDRKPLDLRHSSYGYLLFDEDGRFDPSDFDQEMRLAVESLDISWIENRGPVIDARSRFTRKRLKDQHQWHPGPELESRLIRAAMR